MREARWLFFVCALAGCSHRVDVSCEGDEPEKLDGFETGFARCGGLVHRPEAASCPVFEHEAPEACANAADPDDDHCVTDADCTDSPLGTCVEGCFCRYGCTTDDECEEGEACRCGSPNGFCVPAACTTDADCETTDSLCVETPTTLCNFGEEKELACLRYDDDCATDADCTEPETVCILGHDLIRTCQSLSSCAF